MKISLEQESTKTFQDKQKADEFKGKGNAFIQTGKNSEAVMSYTQAIDLDPTNAVYYSNRA